MLTQLVWFQPPLPSPAISSQANYPDEKFKVLMNRQAVNKPLYKAFRTLALLYLGAILLMEVPESWFCDAAAAAAGCLWSAWPPEWGPWAWLPVGKTDQPPSCPEPCPLHSLPLTFTYQGVVVKPNKPPVRHIWWLPRRMWKVADAQGGEYSTFIAWYFCSGVFFVLLLCNQLIQLLEAGGFLCCSLLM